MYLIHRVDEWNDGSRISFTATLVAGYPTLKEAVLWCDQHWEKDHTGKFIHGEDLYRILYISGEEINHIPWTEINQKTLHQLS